MGRIVLILIALIGGLKYGADYVLSPKFQEYADRTKAPWTCEVNNFFGHFFMVVSRYERAIEFFEKSAERCPKTASAEVAQFEIANSLVKIGHYGQAADAYRQFIEKYKGTKRAKIADRALQIIQGS